MSEHPDKVAAFSEAAKWFCVVVSEIPGDAWSGPGLGEWDLRALVGHTSRALQTAQAARLSAADLAGSAATAALHSPEDYFLGVARLPGASAAAVRDRGVQAGVALGDDAAAACALLVETALLGLGGEGNPLVRTIAGTMRLHDYLSTRTFELVVHGLDICAAIDRAADVPAKALDEALAVTGRLAARGGYGADLLFAATGRRPWPQGVSVLQVRAQ